MAAFHVSIPDGAIADFLAREAHAQGCTVRQLALSLLHCIARDGMAAAILDGEEPGKLFAHGLKQPGRELTDLQERALRAVAHRRVVDGTCVASIGDVALTLGRNRGQARNTLVGLVSRGYLEQVSRGRAYTPSRWRLTDRARPFLVNRERGAVPRQADRPSGLLARPARSEPPAGGDSVRASQ